MTIDNLYTQVLIEPCALDGVDELAGVCAELAVVEERLGAAGGVGVVDVGGGD